MLILKNNRLKDGFDGQIKIYLYLDVSERREMWGET